MKVAMSIGFYRYPESMEEPIVSGSLVGPFYLSRAFAKLGLDVHVFSLGDPGECSESTFDGVKIHRYSSSVKLYSLFEFLASDLRRQKLVMKEDKNGKFEIIQTQSPLFFELFYASRRRIPIVLTDHGSPINTIKDLPLSLLGCVRRFTKRFISQPLYEFTCRRAKKVVMISKTLFENSAKELGFQIAERKLEMVYNGVDTSHFSPIEVNDARSKLEHNENVLVYVGRISYEKGIHNVLKVLPEILKHYPNTSFLIAGAPVSPFKNYFGTLRELAEKEKIKEHVIFHPSIPEKDLPRYYSMGDVLLTPSIYYDPLPNVIFEGMACGLPVISTDFGPRREIITDGKNGFLFPEGDLLQLRDCLLLALSDKRKLRRMGGHSRKLMTEKYDVISTAKRYIELYKNLMNL